MEIPTFLWVILIPVLASPLVYLSGRLDSQSKGRLPHILALMTMLISWAPFTQTAIMLNQGDKPIFTFGTISLCMDGVSLLLSAVALSLSSAAILFTRGYLVDEDGQAKFYALLTAMTGMIVGLSCACDLFNLWVWFEAMAISSYLLVAFYHHQPTSLEAGIKYLVQSACGSALVLIGIGIVLSQTSTLNFSEIHHASPNAGSQALLLVAGALFVTGFGVKTALVPLHTWLPDAHSQAPSGISAMLSGVVIEAGLIAMLRSLAGLAALGPFWGTIIMGFAAVNMLVGNLMALRQTQIKRLLAYSSLTHLGYMLLGIGIAIRFGELNGAQGGLFHLFNHGMMKGLAFLSAGALLYGLYIASGRHGPLTIEDLAGAANRYPLAALTLSLGLLSLGGIPPLSGFMSKWQIMVAGFQTHNLSMGLLAVFAALNSVFSLAYYAPLINMMYRRQPSEIVKNGVKLPWSMQVPLLLLSAAILLFGLWPGLANWLTNPAGSELLSAFGG